MSSLDPYAPCPCGSGKKLKFCCADIAAEIEQIEKMLEAGQRQACLDYIETAEKKHPDKAFLVTTRALLESALGNDAKSAATLADFLEKHPGHPVALAEQAIVFAQQRGAAAGIEPLQRALEAEDDQISGRVVMSVARLGELLLMEGLPLAARGHFLLAYVLYPEDEGTLQLLARYFAAPTIPLVLKNEQALDLAPDGASYKTEFDAAITEARRGRWWRAADKLKQLLTQGADTPTTWRNLATLRSWLADQPGTVAALRKFAAMDVPFEDAVEAEAVAQLLDPEAEDDVVDELRATFEVADYDKLAETLAGDKRAAPFNWQSLGLDFGDQPKPRAGYFLLDRPLPASGVGIRRDEIPHIVGRLLLFGRQTDRAARIEAIVRRTDLEALRTKLGELCGDQIKPSGEPEKVGDMATAEAALSWSWRLPEDVPAEHVRTLVDEQRRDSILNVWAGTPLKVLGGKSPLDAAKEPSLRIPLAAQLLLVEQSFSQPTTEAVFDELRAKLSLPPASPVEPKPGDPRAVPYTRLHLLAVDKLTDDDLVRNYQRALQVAARQSIRKLALQIVARPSLKGKIDLAQVYGHLVDIEGTSDESLRYLDLARHAAEEQKQSTASWDLVELELRMRRGEVQDFSRLINHIQDQHIREPGVAQALMQILYAAGIVDANGRPRAMPAEMAAGAAAAEPEKLWTPGAETAPAAGAAKGGLWVPGME